MVTRLRTISIAANDRDVDAQGNLVKLRDNDCTAGVAGGAAGALCGIEAFQPIGCVTRWRPTKPSMAST